jgi:hypothetical protein
LYPGPLIGVATGVISGIDVIDIDLRRGGDKWFFANHDRLPKTRTHETPSGGWHLIFNHLPGLRTSADRIAPGVEVRANGPHIIWWPAHGGRVICDAAPADFPIWIAELAGWNGNGDLGVTLKPGPDCEFDFTVTPRAPVEYRPTAYQINYGKKALGNACYELRHCEKGRRNHLLNVLAYRMGRLIARGWINLERVEDYLLRACEANGLLDDDGIGQCRATPASGISAGMKRPYRNIETEGDAA